MKKVFKSKLFYLLTFIVVVSSVLIAFCLVTTNKISQNKDYYVEISENSNEYLSKNCYKVHQGNIIKTEYYDAYIEEKENMYSSYIVNDCSIQLFQELNENDIIGVYNSNNVFSKYKSYVYNIEANENDTTVYVYNYDNFDVKVSLNETQYAKKEISNEFTFKLLSDSEEIELTFKGFDLSHFKEDGTIDAIFNTEDCEILINKNSNISVEKVISTYSNAFYMDADVFDNKIRGKYFIYSHNNTLMNVCIYCDEIIDGKAIIESMTQDYTLHEGDILYEI